MVIQKEFVALDSSLFDVKAFDCGKPVMNQYLARHAAKNTGWINMTWVLPADEATPGKKTPVAAYYTLAFSTMFRDEIPGDKGLPGYPVPVVLLARLAVDRWCQGQGLGEKSLVSALRRSVSLTEDSLPIIGLVLDVLDEDALGFYENFGLFLPCTNNPMRLFAPLQKLRTV